MNKTKKLLSLLLIFTVTLSLVGSRDVKAATNKFAGCSVTVQAPYEVYYEFNSESGHADLSDYEGSSDLTDDFGIGLPTDATEFTADRALAKYIRDYIVRTKNITDKEANELMPNYIDISVSSYGVYLNSLSNDGKNWNTGTTKEGKEDPRGYWAVFVNGEMSDVGLSQIKLSDVYNADDIEIKWMVYDPDVTSTYGHFSETNYYCATNKSATLTLYEDTYKWDDTLNKNVKTTAPAVGKWVELYSYDSSKDTWKYVYTKNNTTDNNGKITFSEFNAGEGGYKVVARRDTIYDDGTTNFTYSTLTRTTTWIYATAPPAKPTGIKATVNGKKKAKKKTIKFSWKAKKSYDICYQVYVSTKKSSGYKKVGGDIWNTKQKSTLSKSFTKKKGTYYVKVRSCKVLEIGAESDPIIKKYYSGYTTPKKVKVK